MTRPEVRGVDLDGETRCAHWHSPLDVIAIRMKCCGIYHACKDCHDALAGHAIKVWPRAEWDTPAVMCGICRRGDERAGLPRMRERLSVLRRQVQSGVQRAYRFYFECRVTSNPCTSVMAGRAPAIQELECARLRSAVLDGAASCR